MFKLICDKCKNEIELKDGFETISAYTIFEIYSSRDGRINIECTECGSSITSN